MNIWHDIDEDRVFPTDFMSVIEISKGSNQKYELDKKTGMLSLDRILFTATHYPMNYGFIPRTYGDDKDPLDVLVLCSEPIQPMTLVRSYPIGVMKIRLLTEVSLVQVQQGELRKPVNSTFTGFICFCNMPLGGQNRPSAEKSRH
ncbi:MAG TPA: inorganic diphosphatase [Candidatus Mediterraneibacter vanvlietii]|nr:inorganic diphosphatase [Candidatus Mediterraneibacter vanvlietii]